MKVAIMQPYVFPYLGYFQLVASVDKFIYLDDVNFIKGGWINRNRILVNQAPSFFSLPVSGGSQNVDINTLKLSSEWSHFRKKFIQTLQINYSKAPFRDAGLEIVESVFSSQFDNISDICKSSISMVFDYLGMKPSFVKSSAVYENKSLKSEERILDICKRENASHYMNLPGGKSLYNSKNFSAIDCQLLFIRPHFKSYPQKTSAFIAGLSILDIVMSLSPNEIREMLKFFEVERC